MAPDSPSESQSERWRCRKEQLCWLPPMAKPLVITSLGVLPTSRSCHHGVERWRSDCGCRLDSHTKQSWRRPLREAMDFVKAHADLLYERYAALLLTDPWKGLKESMRLALDPSPDIQKNFFARHQVLQEA